ncbi:MAG: hypothetical protein JSS86_10335 [Cyanobacteria bacterium SZAS LIN-2]|nr:hypothetical protein [Cyanobacteria bacterium SZAS LIN-3]MBS1996701.1 hypothetical protein [Cyanobacteria bacterium SZAS LIN-2]MBS2007417.1 hypothetical protein [Cyanobacteria bacterium SZAS TMP-1]
MKNWTLHILAAFIIQPIVAGLPTLAHDYRAEANHDQHHANREWHDAAKARAEARSSARRGHRISAWLHSRHAAHEAERARRHQQEAREERAIARHHGY